MSAHEAGGRNLAGDLRDADRPAELVGRFPADDDAADIGERAVDHEPGLLHAELDRGRADRPAPAARARR